MNNMPQKLKNKLLADPYYHRCARWKEKECLGRVTWDHCWTYAGKQIQEVWAITPTCIHHHLGAGFSRKKNCWFSINRMTEADEKKYPKFNWKRERIILNKLYGKIQK